MNHELVHYPAFSCMGLEEIGPLATPQSWVPGLWGQFWARCTEIGIQGPCVVWGLMSDIKVHLAPWGGERGRYLASVEVPIGTEPQGDWTVWTIPATTWMRIPCRMGQVFDAIAFAKEYQRRHVEWSWGSAVHERYPAAFCDPATDELDLMVGLLPR